MGQGGFGFSVTGTKDLRSRSSRAELAERYSRKDALNCL